MSVCALLRPLRIESPPPQGRLVHRGLTSVAGLIVQGVIRLAITVAVARLAGVSDLGIVAGAMASAQFLILLWPTTCGQAASRFLARSRGAGDTAALLAVGDHLRRRLLLATAVLTLASVPVSLARGLDVVGAACVAVFLWGVAGQQFTRGVHYGVGAVGRVVTLDIAFSLLGLLGLVLALAAGVRGAPLLLPPALAYVALSLACWPWSARSTGATRSTGPTDRAAGAAESPEVALRRELDAFVFFGSLGTLASAGLVQLSVLVADRLGEQAVGHYAAAVNLALPLTIISGALSLVLYPTMSHAVGRGDIDDVRRQLDLGVRGLLLLVLPALTLVAALAPEVVGLAYGTGFADSARVLPILLLAVLASMIAVPCVNALTSRDSRGIVEIACASLAGLALAALLWARTAQTWGIVGVAVGYAVGAGLIALYGIGRAWAIYRPRWRSLATAVLAAVAVAVTLVVLLEFGPLTGGNVGPSPHCPVLTAASRPGRCARVRRSRSVRCGCCCGAAT